MPGLDDFVSGVEPTGGATSVIGESAEGFRLEGLEVVGWLLLLISDVVATVVGVAVVGTTVVGADVVAGKEVGEEVSGEVGGEVGGEVVAEVVAEVFAEVVVDAASSPLICARVSQLCPEYPSLHVQLQPSSIEPDTTVARRLQFTSIEHGLNRPGARLLGSISQSAPEKVGGQAHMYELIKSVHVPPFAQGLLVHSFTSTVHVSPVKPAAQLHVKLLMLSTQVAPFLQGLLPIRLFVWLMLHSSTSMSQSAPKKPARH